MRSFGETFSTEDSLEETTRTQTVPMVGMANPGLWLSEGLEESSSWCQLKTEHAVKATKDGGYSVYIRDGKGDFDELEEGESLVTKVWNSVKFGVQHFLPAVYYSVHAEALLQESADCSSVGIIVVVRQAATRGNRPPRPPTGTTLVGRTLTPRAVKSGCLRIRLISKDFVADTDQGEDQNLCKSESDFCGQDFEKQFACKYKLGPVREGIFGKVVIEHVKYTEVSTVLEFNLTRGADRVLRTAPTQSIQQTSLSPTKGMQSSDVARRPIHELADSLRITEGQNWRTLADHLGFSRKELCRFASDPEPFNRVVSSYQSRGGTADEIIQALYDVSRQFSTSRVKRQRSVSPAEDFQCRVDDIRKSLPVHSQSSLSSQATVLLGESEDEADDEVMTSRLSRTDSVDLTPKGIFPLTSTPFMMTPPTTPRKRNSSSCSDTESLLARSPVKRMRTSLFSFDDPEDLSRRMCVEGLDESVLWRVSQHMQREWKHVGRTLNMPETELYSIEHAHKDLRECAYQTLLRWKDMFPRKFTYGTLYSALCDNGLSAHAQTFCTL